MAKDTTSINAVDQNGVMFSVTPSGAGPFHFAWTVDGQSAGGDSTSLVVDTTGLGVGNYAVGVVATGSCGAVSVPWPPWAEPCSVTALLPSPAALTDPPLP